MDFGCTSEAIIEDTKRRFARFGLPPNIQPVLQAAAETESLARLGFRPPELYLRLMREIGNGGFGPGYGLMGLVGGWPSFGGHTAVETYLWLREEDDGEDLLPGETLCPPAIPEAMLPICDLGCGIYVCLDCANHTQGLWCLDPACDETPFDQWDMTLQAWLGKWLSGRLPVQYGGDSTAP